MYRLAIFDMDGTLLDTIDDLAVATNQALRRFGFPEHERDAYKLFVGDGIHNLILRAIAPANDAASIVSVEAAFHAYYGEHAQDLTKPYDGIADALRAIHRAGVRLAVFSNKPHEYVGVLAEQYFPGLFDMAVGQREGVPVKPDPTAVREIMQRLGCAPEECIYIGDTGVDIRTGRGAGLATVGVLWGFRTKKELEDAGADVIIDKCSDLVQIIVDK